MTQKEIKKLENRNCKIWDKIREFCSVEERDLISELVDNEILLEAECNK